MTRLVLLLVLLLPTVCAPAQTFSVDTISDAVFARMQGRSFPAGCTVERRSLRYLTLSHYDLEGRVCRGELVCNELIADDLISIFRQLYEARYPIERMQLIDDYDADDERSMQANNTSCFCFRTIAGQQRLSKHALGLAVDVNPRYNPCQKGSVVQPRGSEKYLRRQDRFAYKITRDDLLCRLFLAHGFRWGGSWRSMKDYQHFEK